MTPARGILATGVAVSLALAVSWLSSTPTTHASQSDALLRLSWRTQGTMVEECRTRTEEELAAMAPHMRTPEVCTGRGADYELVVEADGAEVVRDTIRPAGARRDRPVYVFRELAVEPGSHDLTVGFRALVPADFEPADGRPVELSWEGSVRVEPTEIALFTLDDSGRALTLRAR